MYTNQQKCSITQHIYCQHDIMKLLGTFHLCTSGALMAKCFCLQKIAGNKFLMITRKQHLGFSDLKTGMKCNTHCFNTGDTSRQYLIYV